MNAELNITSKEAGAGSREQESRIQDQESEKLNE
ncbi:MAG: hypothetical protein QOI34_467 [Verrucomicrobiota bacterium]